MDPRKSDKPLHLYWVVYFLSVPQERNPLADGCSFHSQICSQHLPEYLLQSRCSINRMNTPTDYLNSFDLKKKKTKKPNGHSYGAPPQSTWAHLFPVVELNAYHKDFLFVLQLVYARCSCLHDYLTKQILGKYWFKEWKNRLTVKNWA